MNEEEIRNATRTGINDAVGDILKGVTVAACVIAIFAYLSWPAILVLLFVIVPVLMVIWGIYERLTGPRRERRETAEAKARARKYWLARGWSEEDIDKWDAEPKSDWWWIGKER
jgi:hypothetical protein